jgi:CPA2 family monovalent cation:H+ antiporter-2
MHSAPLISTIVFAFVLAFTLGLVAQRLRLPPLVGYLLAGIALGPFTPGVVADQNVANQLAEIGVILLMFGVGLHFSFNDLLSVRAIAIPGALVQAVVAIPLAMGLAWWLGWGYGAGLVFGIGLSIASTVVVLRMLQDRRLLDTERGKITVGWLIVQDLAMVLVLVLLPVLAGVLRGEGEAPEPKLLLEALAITFGKIAGFVIIMLVVGKKLIPALLHYVAHTGSRELFRLAVLAVALGFAYGSAELFGVSLALGAFFAGMILSESRLSQQAAAESLPLRDAFAVIFFVSVGMLFDPHILMAQPLALLATLFIVVVGKTIAAYGLVRLSGYGPGSALTISSALAQIGEFSFILAGLGVALAILPKEGRDLIIAAAIISILISPLLFAALDVLAAKRAKLRDETAPPPEPEPEEAPREPIRPTHLHDHVVLIGHGRVGSAISKVLIENGIPFFVIEDDDDAVDALKAQGIEAVSGNAADPEIIGAANLGAARCLFVAIPEAFEGGQVVQQARAINPSLPIIARAHSEDEIAHLAKHGANLVVMGEHEIAKAMIGHLPATAAAVPA